MNSKAKGGAFERDCCKKLSLWVSGGKQQDCFWRSAMSGGRATVRNRSVAGRVRRTVVRQGGDIASVAPEGHALTDKFYVECKCYKLLALDRFLLLNTGNLAKFWQETCKQAKRYGKQPMLIAKQNGLPTIVVTDGPGNYISFVRGDCYEISLFHELLLTEFSEWAGMMG